MVKGVIKFYLLQGNMQKGTERKERNREEQRGTEKNIKEQEETNKKTENCIYYFLIRFDDPINNLIIT